MGGRLIPRLLEAGYHVRAVGRSLERLRIRAWASHPAVELLEADILDRSALLRASQGCRVLYHLVHTTRPAPAAITGPDLEQTLTFAQDVLQPKLLTVTGVAGATRTTAERILVEGDAVVYYRKAVVRLVPAPTSALRPTVTPGRMVAFAPTFAPRLMCGARRQDLASAHRAPQ